MTESKKCSHPPCRCTIPEGEEYCSGHCESAGSAEESMCGCGHPACSESAKL